MGEDSSLNPIVATARVSRTEGFREPREGCHVHSPWCGGPAIANHVCHERPGVVSALVLSRCLERRQSRAQARGLQGLAAYELCYFGCFACTKKLGLHGYCTLLLRASQESCQVQGCKAAALEQPSDLSRPESYSKTAA